MQESFANITEKHSSNPFDMLTQWLENAKLTKKIKKDATAFSLATSSKNGRPSVRFVLLKFFDFNSFVFFSNANSQKGKNLNANSRSLLLLGCHRQANSHLWKERIPDIDRQYFAPRVMNSQIAASISKQ